MKRYSTVHPIFMAFYSADLYRDVGANWKGISFLYLFLLLAVCLIPVTFRMRAVSAEFLLQQAPKVIEQMPVITLSKGKVSIDGEVPYTIKDPESGSPLLIIDTTGRTTSFAGTDAAMILTESRLLVRRDSQGAWSYDLSDIGDVVIDRAKVYTWVETFLDSFVVILYPFVLLTSYLYRVVQALFFGIIGLLLSRGLRVSLSYFQVVGLAIVAMTPSIILNTIYTYSAAGFALWWLISFTITLAYLVFGVKANGQTEGTGG